MDTRRRCLPILLFSLLIYFASQQAAAEINISIAVFDPGIPADASSHRELLVFPKIREIEALFLPFVLRRTLVVTNEWGAVRVVPEPDFAAELLVSGAIIGSDGETLELRLQAIDASGRVWLDKAYAGKWADSIGNGNGNGDAKSGMSGYQELYDEIAKDLQVARDGLDDRARKDIVEVSRLRYAVQLAPTVFGDYLISEPDGTFRISRLPAENDPTLERIERIRSVEYVITDTVDEKFQELHAEIASTYDLWRRYRRQFTQYEIEEAERVQNTESAAPRGSFEEMERSYDNYRWARMAEQEQENWARGFDNEVGPTVERLESRVTELESWVDDRYAEWQRLLAEIFSLETGLTE